jgi:hypothetical protein|tara:strand:- start:27807 stop:28085 length:279 start_codon:yes stop_codon:yes gene_type:complete
MTPNFNEKLRKINESLELIEERHYAKWLDQKGRKVYPGKLSPKEMKKVLPRRIGFFQKGGHVYSLPLIPTTGKIQKDFRKYYRKTFGPRPFK